MIDLHDVLHCPMGKNDAQAATIGEFLGLLLSTLWLEDEGFSGKRPFGNSGWKWQVYEAMVQNNLASGTIVEDEGYLYLEDFSYEEELKADELILQAIRLAYNHG